MTDDDLDDDGGSAWSINLNAKADEQDEEAVLAEQKAWREKYADGAPTRKEEDR